MNKNQKIVLAKLKEENEFTNPLSCIYVVLVNSNICDGLTEREEFEVLAEFAEWGLEDE